ncbi:MAG: DUF1778 domain-containing protein [Firmicutes bacterium]|nr:DUF1778 domain-containing protein [Bacillota bacterium]
MDRATPPSRKDARLEIRVPVEVKAILDEAAALSGVSTSAFVLATSMPHARELVQQAHSAQLSPKESRAFVDQLLNPPAPNPALRTAAARYLHRVDRSS